MLLYLVAAVFAISIVGVSASYNQPANAGNISQATRCAEELFRMLDALAKYYCRTRYVPTSEDIVEQEYDLYTTLDSIELLSECAYGGYNFLHGLLPVPYNRGNAEADKMMTACLVQQAALRFLKSSPDRIEGRDAFMCPATALKLRVFEPFTQSADYLHTLNFSGMLEFMERPPCLAAVLSSFARQSLYDVALKQPPPAPTPRPFPFNALPSTKLLVQEYDLTRFPAGVEWPMMLEILKVWYPGEVKGIMIEEGPDDAFPRVLVYYEVKT